MKRYMKRISLLVLFGCVGIFSTQGQIVDIDRIFDEIDPTGIILPDPWRNAIRDELSKLGDQIDSGNGIMSQVLQGFVPGMMLMSSIGSSWSDAYIGQITDRPPHFALGGTLGVSFLPIRSLTTVSNAISETLESVRFPYLPIPSYTTEARIGGFGIPFDIGFKFGILPNSSISDLTFNMVKNLFDLRVDYLLVGFDTRISLVKEKKFLPQISIVPSYSFTRFGIRLGVENLSIPGLGGDITITDGAGLGDVIVNIDLPESIDMSFESHVMELKMMLSKKLLFFEPMLGISGVVAVNKGAITLTGGDVTWRSASSIPGLANVDGSLKGYGFSFPSPSFNNHVKWGVRAFGGFGLAISKLHIDFMGSYEILSQAFSLSTGIRVQI